jgi:hypothetical protein
MCYPMTWVIPLNLPEYTISDAKFEPRTKWTQAGVIKRNDAKHLHCAATLGPQDQEQWADRIWRTASAVEGCLWATLRSECPWPSGTLSVPHSSAGRSLQHLHAEASFRRYFLIKIILACLHCVLFKIISIRSSTQLYWKDPLQSCCKSAWSYCIISVTHLT